MLTLKSFRFVYRLRAGQYFLLKYIPNPIYGRKALSLRSWFIIWSLVVSKQSRFDSSRFDTKQWNCTKISIKTSIVCGWTWKTFWVNIFRSWSQVLWALNVELFTPELNKLVSKGPLFSYRFSSGRSQYIWWFSHWSGWFFNRSPSAG